MKVETTFFIKFPESHKVEIAQINDKKFFILHKAEFSNYVLVPNELNSNLISEGIEIFPSNNQSEKSLSIMNIFLKTLSKFDIYKKILFKKKLFLKGTGLRATYDSSTNSLILKIGFSHLSQIPIPVYIKNIHIKKNIITFESSDLILLNNFIRIIFEIRQADSYKGKGFSFPYQNKQLKIVDKK